MSWFCKDCGEEMKPDILTIGNRSSVVPEGWKGASLCEGYDKDGNAYGWGRTIFHEACADRLGSVRDSEAVWIPAPKTGVVEALEQRDMALSDALANLVSVVEQLVPEESARGVANLVLFQARSLLPETEEAERCGK